MSPTVAPGPVLVVGASLAGATVAATLREVGWAGELTLLGTEDVVPYERPALSKTYLSGTADPETLLVHPPAYYVEHDITLRLGETAVGLDADGHRVLLGSGEAVPFATLVVATGAANTRPPIPGIDLGGVHQLRTLADADALRTHLARARTAVVVGMGFIGCEIAASLREAGLAVTAVDALPGPLWAPLGPELSAVVRGWHTDHGVAVRTGVQVASIRADATGAAVAGVELAGGEVLPADLVVVGVGVRPSTGWLAGSRVELVAGAVAVDGDGRSSLPGVYAVGDVTTTLDATTGGHQRREHWSAAIAQGRRVARHLAGVEADPPAAPYFWSDQYDRTLQYAGQHAAESRLVLRGDTGGPFTGFFLDGASLVAVLSVNDGKQFRRGQRLLGSAPDPAALEDPTVDLRRLT